MTTLDLEFTTRTLLDSTTVIDRLNPCVFKYSIDSIFECIYNKELPISIIYDHNCDTRTIVNNLPRALFFAYISGCPTLDDEPSSPSETSDTTEELEPTTAPSEENFILKFCSRLSAHFSSLFNQDHTITILHGMQQFLSLIEQLTLFIYGRPSPLTSWIPIRMQFMQLISEDDLLADILLPMIIHKTTNVDQTKYATYSPYLPTRITYHTLCQMFLLCECDSHLKSFSKLSRTSTSFAHDTLSCFNSSQLLDIPWNIYLSSIMHMIDEPPPVLDMPHVTMTPDEQTWHDAIVNIVTTKDISNFLDPSTPEYNGFQSLYRLKKGQPFDLSSDLYSDIKFPFYHSSPPSCSIPDAFTCDPATQAFRMYDEHTVHSALEFASHLGLPNTQDPDDFDALPVPPPVF
jgi:hypothetical protein